MKRVHIPLLAAAMVAFVGSGAIGNGPAAPSLVGYDRELSVGGMPIPKRKSQKQRRKRQRRGGQ